MSQSLEEEIRRAYQRLDEVERCLNRMRLEALEEAVTARYRAATPRESQLRELPTWLGGKVAQRGDTPR